MGFYWTVPELLFEKKQLIPALQQLIISYSKLAKGRMVFTLFSPVSHFSSINNLICGGPELIYAIDNPKNIVL